MRDVLLGLCTVGLTIAACVARSFLVPLDMGPWEDDDNY
jgi:hypothetical protein